MSRGVVELKANAYLRNRATGASSAISCYVATDELDSDVLSCSGRFTIIRDRRGWSFELKMPVFKQDTESGTIVRIKIRPYRPHFDGIQVFDFLSR